MNKTKKIVKKFDLKEAVKLIEEVARRCDVPPIKLLKIILKF